MIKHLAAAVTVLVAAAPLAANNPQFRGADPHAIMIGDVMWVFPTGGPVASWDADRFHAFSSSDLKQWQDRGELMRRDQILWVGDDGAPRRFLWAPGIVTHKGKWFLYYSLGPNTPKPSHIGVAVADKPEGPYKDSGRPLLTGRAGFEAIDPMTFVDPKNGKIYLYAGGSAGSTLRVFELNSDMMSIKREIAVTSPPHFTEGAFMHEREGTYYLSYSHGRFNGASYSVHYATAPTSTGPWTYRGAILESDATRKGPGHHSFVQIKGGKTLIVYHRWENPAEPEPYQGERQIAIDIVNYNPDGTIKPVRMTDGAHAPILPARK